jgi:hypothetical protein
MAAKTVRNDCNGNGIFTAESAEDAEELPSQSSELRGFYQ